MTLDDLKKFCASKDDPRSQLWEPWTRDGFTWATNGHIIVRVPVIDGVTDNPKAPDAAAMMAKYLKPKEWLPVPPVTLSEKEDCRICYGHGVHDCGCGDEHECCSCEGTGKQEARPAPVAVGDAHFADRYLAMIEGWEIAPNGNEPAWIRRDDALGLLMPMRK